MEVLTDLKLAESPPASQTKWLRCNGQQLRKLAKAGLLWLDQHHQFVNSLNVFPVPDGDTGTNMLLTMRSAYKRIEGSEEMHVGKLANLLAQGALMGARGNSGVILSQIWRGLARGLQDKETFNAADLAQALQAASDTAYNGVMRPVEGTILTIIREGAAEAADAVGKSDDLRFLLERVLERCQQALERTPELLPILKQAGVLDSGGQGLVFILEGMLRYTHGQMLLDEEPGRGIILAAELELPAQAHAIPEGGSLEFPYDVQLLLTGQNLNVTEVRRAIDTMGDSTVVVGDQNTIKVHVHVKDPGRPISFCSGLGTISDVVVENMQQQMEQIVNQPAQPELPAPEPPTTELPTLALPTLALPTLALPTAAQHARSPLPELVLEPDQIGVVAVAPGFGLAEIFRSLGASFVVNGGQTNNPSTEEIFQAIEESPTNRVIVLPNNKNVFLAAEAARDLSQKQVAVVPTRNIPQGVSALLSLDRDNDVESAAAAMAEAAALVRTGEITRATRSVALNGVDVEEGEIIGLLDGNLCASGANIQTVVNEVLSCMELDTAEILSIYYGADVAAEEAEQLGQYVRSRYPDIEVEVVVGGQAHYFYIFGAE
jgi:DAK2 domain fusion protein YloV